MKKLLFIFSALLFSIYLVSPCTSFAINSNVIIYGSNFDYSFFSDFELYFTVDKIENMKIFRLSYKYNNILYKNVFEMNDKGLYYVQHSKTPPDENIKNELAKNELYINDMGKLINEYSKVRQIENYLKDKILVTHPRNQKLHSLSADKSGDFMIIEIGKQNNEIVRNNDKFIVMTNFQNSDFKNKQYNEIFGFSSDRYKTAYEYINSNINDFNIEKGWEVLKKTKQIGSIYTYCSMIFDPNENNIYIVLNCNFNKILKLSINNSKIETYKGFENKKEVDINGKLVSSKYLLEFN